MTRSDLIAHLSGLHQRIAALKERPQLASVSGVVTTSLAMLKYFDQDLTPFTMVTTKSFQVVPNPGNREPILCEVASGSFGNSVGLRNQGMTLALEELQKLRDDYEMRTLLNVSISGSTIEDFCFLAKAFEPVMISWLNFVPTQKRGMDRLSGVQVKLLQPTLKPLERLWATQDL